MFLKGREFSLKVWNIFCLNLFSRVPHHWNIRSQGSGADFQFLTRITEYFWYGKKGEFMFT